MHRLKDSTWLYTAYVVEKRSTHNIAKEIGCSAPTVSTALKRNDIQIRKTRDKISTDDFIKLANDVHNNKYDYSKTKYHDWHSKVSIICYIHGEFSITANSHIHRKSGCYLCGVDQRKATSLEKYGTENPMQNDEVRARFIGTMIDRYGVKYSMQNDGLKTKAANTNYIRYGYNTPSKNITIKERTTESNLDKYGCKYPCQSHMIDILPLIEDKQWLFEQYIFHHKTATQIAYELAIDNSTICDYLHKHEIEMRSVANFSMLAIFWLDSIMNIEGIFIQHGGNIGEYKIPQTQYRADGYCKETNTVYEFHGDRFHGNPDVFDSDEYCHPFKDIYAGELYNKTILRENEIKRLGYNLVVMWENDFKSKKKEP